MSLPARLMTAIIRLYQRALSPLMGPSCRYYPTCSHYTAESIRRHGAVRGGWLGTTRILRCHPWGGEGADPVPDPLPPRWWLGRQNHPSPNATPRARPHSTNETDDHA